METISRLILTFLLNALWQIAVVAGAAALAAWLLRNTPARLQHRLWVVALVASVFLPVASLRSIHLVAAGRVARLDGASAAGSPIAPRTAPAWPKFPFGDVTQNHAWRPVIASFLGIRPVAFSPTWGYPLAAAYLLFLLYRLARLLRAWQTTKKIRQSAARCELTGGTAAIAAKCQSALGVRDVTILGSFQVSSPATLGFRRPLIILPEKLIDGASADDLTTALGHEMAHVRRSDFLFNLLYEVFYLPISFHPGARLMKKQIDGTRELACDALAAELVNPKDYAHSLLRMARAAGSQPISPAPHYTLGVFDADILEERMIRLLSRTPLRSTLFTKTLAAMSLAILGAFSIAAASFCLAVSPQKGAATGSAAKPSDPAHFVYQARTYVMERPDFSGRWVLDKTKSRLSPASPSDLVQWIDHHERKLTIKTTSKDWSGGPISLTLFALMIPVFEATTDETESVLSYGPGQLMSKTRWDHNRLVTDWKLERDGQVVMIGKWVRYLSEDEKTLTLEIIAQDHNQGGKGEAKLVFAKRALDSDRDAAGGNAAGTAAGAVFDPSGARVPNALVTLINEVTGDKRNTTASDAGEFKIAEISPGRYHLEARSPGFATYHGSEFALARGAEQSPLTVVLQPELVTETVNVMAKAPATSADNPGSIRPSRIRVGGLIQAPKQISSVPPEYPESSRVNGIQGVVLLQAVISMEGVPLSLKVLSSPDEELSRSAMDAVRQWRYEPTRLNGNPIEVVTEIAVRFRLER